MDSAKAQIEKIYKVKCPACGDIFVMSDPEDNQYSDVHRNFGVKWVTKECSFCYLPMKVYFD